MYEPVYPWKVAGTSKKYRSFNLKNTLQLAYTGSFAQNGHIF